MLINSPLYRDAVNDNEQYLPSLGQGYIATQLLAHGTDVKMIDAVSERLGVDDLISLISFEKPDFVGLNIFTQNYDLVKEVAESIAQDAKLFLGGATVKHAYGDILQWDIKCKADLIIGEGELIIPALVDGSCLQPPFMSSDGARINVYEVNRDSSYFPEDLDNIILDRSLFANRLLTNHYGQTEAAIITSRGCPYNCAFCGGAYDLNRDSVIRMRSSHSVISEINQIIQVSQDPVASIRILDDLFLGNKQSLHNAIEIFSSFESLKWRAMAHVLTFKRNPEFASCLHDSGCEELFVGIESGSDRIRKMINKAGSVQNVKDVVCDLLAHGIDVKGYFMMGLPTETEEEAFATYRLATDLINASKVLPGNFRTSVFQFRPYYGTKLYDLLLKNGLINKHVEKNEQLAYMKGRSQFSFHSGNYSAIPDDILYEMIERTQGLN